MSKQFKWSITRKEYGHQVDVIAVNRDAAIQAAKNWYRELLDWLEDKTERDEAVAQFVSEISAERLCRA